MQNKSFDPKTLQDKWYEIWENANYFSPQGQGKPYSIAIPPPNVTGSLHMGHAFQQTLMDILIRFHRMQEENTLWLVGTDHAGIATQMVVERQLAANNITKQELGREAFIKKIWDWKKESGDTITQQMRCLGASLDWSRERFTLDTGLSEAVQEVFIKLYEENLIYKGKRLVNWDPILKTAVSDLEVESTEEAGFLWHINYPLSDNSGFITIATTRPETLLGDVAVAVNPTDLRYIHLIGKTLNLPLTNRTIPIIADDYVEADFGTGAVKITPAHDFNDYEIGKRHQLEMINILTKDGYLNNCVPEPYRGLERFKAREKILEDLKTLKLLIKTENHVLKVPRGDRSNAILEPLLTDQWYVKVGPLAEPAIKAVKEGQIKFIPENWSKTYFDWMENLQDWCISRQLWWGHQIPAWYDEQGKVYVGKSEEEIRSKYNLAPSISLSQDEDVLDTWFSSALWPFSTLGWPNNTHDLKTFYPTSVLVTGFDIIFFWVARMIMFGLKFTNNIPFKEIYITGLVQDENGQKMSKTKGNVIDPIDLIDGIALEALIKKRTSNLMQPQLAPKIEKYTRNQFPKGISAYGVDALRFTFSSMASFSRQLRFDITRLESYRFFCNKLWNANRYVLMNTENKFILNTSMALELSPVDEWILSIWQMTKQNVFNNLNQYRFDLASQTLYDFTWNEYCDWYLELSKPLLNPPHRSISQKYATQYILLSILEELLRTLHPFMPFITEELWQDLKPILDLKAPSIMVAAYPLAQPDFINEAALNKIEWFKKVILSIRNIRGEMNITPNKTIHLFVYNANEHERDILQEFIPFLESLAKVSSLQFINKQEVTEACASAVIHSMELLIPLKGLIDEKAESTRLNKEIEKNTKELLNISQRLKNQNYLDKAPAAVVQKEKKRAEELKVIINTLEERLKGYQA
ncbi:MAG: valine--tRNA ligase [Francisellaceae bacterium]|nr:valine--tRNA ligase [Francisellaceae bacterium]